VIEGRLLAPLELSVINQFLIEKGRRVGNSWA
jgi:hypothetical protein